MPSKRPSLENPPSASSSSASSTEDDASQEEEEEETTPFKTSSKKPSSNSNPVPTSVSQSHALVEEEDDSESGDDTDSDDDTDSQVPSQHRPSTAPLDIKPISSKPMNEASKTKKSSTITTSSGTPVVALESAKRRLENDEKDSRKDKKKKKVTDLVEDEDTEKKAGGDEKKLFQKVWTEEDEIVILKGMINFKKKGMDPTSQVGAFFDTIKDSLHADFTKTQLQSKIRTLKRRFQNAAKKAKPGEDPDLKPREAKMYQLSKKIWNKEIVKDELGEANNGGNDAASVDIKKSKIKKMSDHVASSPKPKATTLPNDTTVVAQKEAKEENEKTATLEYIYLNESVLPRNFSLTPIPPPELGKFFVNRGWDGIGNSELKGLDQRWKNVMIAEAKAYLQRLDLVREQTQAMLEALESPKL